MSDLSLSQKVEYNKYVSAGRSLYTVHDYHGALDSFRRAFVLFPEKSVQRRIYQLEVLLKKQWEKNHEMSYSPIPILKKIRPTCSEQPPNQDEIFPPGLSPSRLGSRGTLTRKLLSDDNVSDGQYKLDISTPVAVSDAISKKLSSHGFHKRDLLLSFPNTQGSQEIDQDSCFLSGTPQRNNKDLSISKPEIAGNVVPQSTFRKTFYSKSQPRLYCTDLDYNIDERGQMATLPGEFKLPLTLYNQLHWYQKQGVAWMWSLHPYFQTWCTSVLFSGKSSSIDDVEDVRNMELKSGSDTFREAHHIEPFQIPEFSGGILADDMGLGKT